MIRRITSLAVLLICTIALAQTDSPSSKPSDSESGPWHKIKSATGHTKSKPVMVKFQPGTTKWRLSIKATADKDTSGRANPSANIRVALMAETLRDVDDKPVNWSQVDTICNGKPQDIDARLFTNGLAKDGKGKWFQLVISGYLTDYEVTIEDQSADDSAKAAKSKSKKKKDKDSGGGDGDDKDR
jgi:hypothetical protein